MTTGSTIDPADEAPSLVGLLDGLVDQGLHVAGDLTIGLADVELIRVALRLLVASEDTAGRTGVRTARSLHRDPDPAGPLPRSVPPRRPGPSDGATRPGPVRRELHRPSGAGSLEQADRDQVARGVSQLVLTVVALIHELIERQAIRRVDAGTLTDEQIERLGVALQALEDRMDEVKEIFGLTDDDLNLDLGPLGTLR